MIVSRPRPPPHPPAASTPIPWAPVSHGTGRLRRPAEVTGPATSAKDRRCTVGSLAYRLGSLASRARLVRSLPTAELDRNSSSPHHRGGRARGQQVDGARGQERADGAAVRRHAGGPRHGAHGRDRDHRRGGEGRGPDALATVSGSATAPRRHRHRRRPHRRQITVTALGRGGAPSRVVRGVRAGSWSTRGPALPDGEDFSNSGRCGVIDITADTIIPMPWPALGGRELSRRIGRSSIRLARHADYRLSADAPRSPDPVISIYDVAGAISTPARLQSILWAPCGTPEVWITAAAIAHGTCRATGRSGRRSSTMVAAGLRLVIDLSKVLIIDDPALPDNCFSSAISPITICSAAFI